MLAGVLAGGSTASLVERETTKASGKRLHGGAFFSNCRFSHTSNDDPIVYPRRPGRSHAHTFFGNASTNASSTLASLRRARTTHSLAADTAAYWIPTPYEGGRAVKPAKGRLYNVMRGYDEMRPFPAGLRRGSPVSRRTFLELHVTFPDCWDGVHLDSPDHKSHMAYSREYSCPATHPVKVPLSQLNVQYPTTGGDDVALASGGPFSSRRLLQRLGLADAGAPRPGMLPRPVQRGCEGTLTTRLQRPARLPPSSLRRQPRDRKGEGGSSPALARAAAL